MALKRISDSILYVGADDRTIDLFENQYPVSNGVTYNSYVIKDSKIAVMDTVDERATDQWFDNLEEAFEGKAPDYLVVSHLEPDHSGNIERFLKKYPDTIVVANAKTFAMLPQFIDIDVPEDKRFVAAEGTTLALGKHVLTFVMAPMVHWPEVMVEYESTEKVLFSADGFGTFGALGDRLKTSELENMPQSWADEARRYFINIVGKYGPSVQGLLKKASALDISVIAPLHGPVIDKDFDFYIDKYMKWSDRGNQHMAMDFYIPKGAPVIDHTTGDIVYATETHYGEYPYPNNSDTSAGGYFSDKGSAKGEGFQYQKTSFVKVKNICLGYTFPKKWITKAGLQHLRLYINVLNPFCFTDYDGFDPEWANAKLTDGGPASVTYQIGANIKF